MPSPHSAPEHRRLDIEIGQMARDELERLLRLRRVAALIPQTLDTLAKLTGVADITYIAVATGFVYLAAILDAWSRRVVGYAIGRRVDARLALAALRAEIESRQPPEGSIHHSDRGSQYAAEGYRADGSSWPQWFHGPTRQSLRQCQG
jgi:transposase InsO family protein